MIGPFWTFALGAWFLVEPVGTLQLVGTAIVIAGILMLSRTGTQQGGAPKEAECQKRA